MQKLMLFKREVNGFTSEESLNNWLNRNPDWMVKTFCVTQKGESGRYDIHVLVERIENTDKTKGSEKPFQASVAPYRVVNMSKEHVDEQLGELFDALEKDD